LGGDIEALVRYRGAGPLRPHVARNRLRLVPQPLAGFERPEVRLVPPRLEQSPIQDWNLYIHGDTFVLRGNRARQGDLVDI
jgi:hypothetical protein